jgi:energy-coupling factor transport system ATP-binding protein
MALIEVEAVSYTYPNGVRALKDIELVIEAGSFVAVVGPNGAGKTSLIKMFNGLLRPQEGKVRLLGQEVAKTSTAQLARRVGFVFQNPLTQLFLGSVRDEVAFGPQKIGMPKDLINQRVNYTVQLSGLSGQTNTHPYDLSPSERKLLTIAAILSMDPEILIMDEPTAGLDQQSRRRVVHIVEKFLENQRTVIAVSHDMDFVASSFQRVIIMNRGKIIADGATRQVFSQHELLADNHLEPTAISHLAGACGLPRTLLTVQEIAAYIMDAL